MLIMAVAFCWPWVAAPTVYLAHVISPSMVSPQVTILPLITAASFPLLLLTVLSMLVLKQLPEIASPDDSQVSA